MQTRTIQTLKGPVAVQALGLILPHEHLFVDLRGPSAPDYALADPETVGRLVKPYLDAARAAGVTVLVDCGTVGVGRNVTVLRHLAEISPIHIVAPTGVYREAFVPSELRSLSAEALADLWIRDLTEGMEDTQTRAGFIKIALSDDGPTELEKRNLRAAAIASEATGAVIASHTIGGAAAQHEMDILEAARLNLRRFIWVHAQTERDRRIHEEAARRGAYLEFDAIGAANPPQDAMLEVVVALLEAGHADRILLSHDAGWYDPGQPDGLPKPDGFRGYTALIEQFIPALRTRDVSESTIHQLTVTNPAHALAFS